MDGEDPEAAEAPAATQAETRAVEVEVRMTDGAVYLGTIYIDEGGRVLDFVNRAIPFFALTERNNKVRILAKAQVMQIVPYDRGGAPVREGQAGRGLL